MVPNFDISKLLGESLKMQKDFLETISSIFKLISSFSIINKNVAVFRAKIQAGGRISIPEAEKIALGLQDGDIVRVIIVKEGGEGDGDEGVYGSE